MMHDRKSTVLLLFLGGLVLLIGSAVLLLLVPHWEKSPASPPAGAEPALAKPEITAVPEDPLMGVSSRQLVDLGNRYGRDGDWRKAFNCFRQVVAAGSQSEWEWSWATASALAAGEISACEELCRQMLQLFGQHPNPDVAERCAKQCLALPGVSGNLLNQAGERADFAVAMDGASRWRQLAKGMAEYRRGNWAEALRFLRPPETSHLLDVSVQAWSFGAMARCQIGDAAAARQALEEANRRLKMGEQTGELGHPQYNTWDNWARALAVRAEAERLILGREVSPPPVPAAVAEGRRKWQPVLKLLDAGEKLAQQGRWQEAGAAYVQALESPAFNWEISELKQDLLEAKVLAVYALAGTPKSHQDVVRVLLDRYPEKLLPVIQERYAQVILSHTAPLPPDLTMRGVALARQACQNPGAEKNPWLWFVRGLADYREGRHEEAIANLDRASFSKEPVFRARALVFQAMACKALGRPEEAARKVQEASLVVASAMGQGALWHQAAFYQLALKEFLAVPPTQVVPAKSR